MSRDDHRKVSVLPPVTLEWYWGLFVAPIVSVSLFGCFHSNVGVLQGFDPQFRSSSDIDLDNNQNFGQSDLNDENQYLFRPVGVRSRIQTLVLSA